VEHALALVIEDNREIGLIFSEAAQEAGYETEIIASGDAALRRLSAVVPALVILDLHLPRVEGTTILDQIRSDPRLKETRVIVATAEARWAEQLHDLADLVLLKPVSFLQLRDLAARLNKDGRRASPA
jgi:two-component system phosphate regulon response regulator PhoB